MLNFSKLLDQLRAQKKDKTVELVNMLVQHVQLSKSCKNYLHINVGKDGEYLTQQKMDDFATKFKSKLPPDLFDGILVTKDTTTSTSYIVYSKEI